LILALDVAQNILFTIQYIARGRDADSICFINVSYPVVAEFTPPLFSFDGKSRKVTEQCVNTECTTLCSGSTEDCICHDWGTVKGRIYPMKLRYRYNLEELLLRVCGFVRDAETIKGKVWRARSVCCLILIAFTIKEVGSTRVIR
jgi:hypothetical protein